MAPSQRPEKDEKSRPLSSLRMTHVVDLSIDSSRNQFVQAISERRKRANLGSPSKGKGMEVSLSLEIYMGAVVLFCASIYHRTDEGIRVVGCKRRNGRYQRGPEDLD